MKIFDGHSDILTNITIKRLAGNKNVFENDHLENLNKGNISSIISVIWIDPPHTDNPSWRMLEVLGALCEEIEDMHQYAEIVYTHDDFNRIHNDGKIAILLGMEGLSGLKGNVSILNMLHKLGIRHASLTWNEENEFATGVTSQNKNRGLTKLGISALKRMEELGIIVDVSHCNIKSFWDIYENTEKPFIASHSNVLEICDAPRNLNRDQIIAIAKRGGTIGFNSAPDFIGKENLSLDSIYKHIDFIVSLVGIDHVAFGFDFADFLDSQVSSSFSGYSISFNEFNNVTNVPSLIEYLSKKGYSDVDIQKIAYGNLDRVVKQIIK